MVRGEGGLSTEDLNGLLRCLPSADERDMLQRHSARYAELGMAEQFMLTMMSISQVTSLPIHFYFRHCPSHVQQF